MGDFGELRRRVLDANLALVDAGLVVLTWGNASGADRAAGVMAIKPSGISYRTMTADDIVVLEIETGRVVAGDRRPSSDTPTHLHIYRAFASVGGVVHTHSLYGTSFAQAGVDLPCMGTTHADNFYGTIPCTRPMERSEVETDYEVNTGRVIEDALTTRQISPDDVPGVLVASHAPFAWGATPEKAVENAIVLEFSAQLALNTWRLNPDAGDIPRFLLDKHYRRKHGPNAYYGQT